MENTSTQTENTNVQTENVNTQTEVTNTQTETQPESITMTQAELDAKLQSETDKRVSQAIKTAQAKWESEFNQKLESEKQEAAKLAKMSAEERERAKFAKEKEAFEKEKAEMARVKLEAETVKQLSTENLPTEFAKYVVGQDAESTLANINEFKESWQKALYQLAQDKLNATKTQKTNFDNATNERRNSFANLKPLATKIINAFAVSGADTLAIADAKTVNKKLQGTSCLVLK
jgi:hypothetical protein